MMPERKKFLYAIGGYRLQCKILSLLRALKGVVSRRNGLMLEFQKSCGMLGMCLQITGG